MKNLFLSVTATLLTAFVAILVYVVKKLVDEHWDNRRTILERWMQNSLFPGALALIGIYAGFLFHNDAPVTKLDVFMGVITAVIAVLALILRLVLSLREMIDLIMASPSLRAERNRPTSGRSDEEGNNRKA